MKKSLFTLSLIAGIILISIPSVMAQSDTVEIPSWIKGVANFWIEGGINDEEFVEALEFLIDNNVIKLGENVVVDMSEQENPFGIEEDTKTVEEKHAETVAYLDKQMKDQKEEHEKRINEIIGENEKEQTEHIGLYQELSTKYDKLWAEYTRLYGNSNEVRELTNPDDFK